MYAIPRRPENPTLNDWLPHYRELIALRDIKDKTRQDKLLWCMHLSELIGDRALDTLRPSDIAGAGKAMQMRGLDTSARRVIIEAKDIFNEAVLSDWSYRNPADAVRPPRVKVRRMRLSAEVWKSMLSRCSRKSVAHRMLRLALVSAQRRADLSCMRFDQVFDGHLWVRQLKTGRQIAIPLELALPEFGLVLGDVIEDCREAAKGSAFMLPKRNGMPSPPAKLSYEFIELRKLVLAACDVPPGRTLPSLHEVRSLAERSYRDIGVDTQALLGHKFPSTTNTYNDGRGINDGQWKFVRLHPNTAAGATMH